MPFQYLEISHTSIKNQIQLSANYERYDQIAAKMQGHQFKKLLFNDLQNQPLRSIHSIFETKSIIQKHHS